VNCATLEKYFGIIKARRGRIAGRHAHVIPALTSSELSDAWAGLSNDRSVLVATLWTV
jgi:hypothetical protein